MDIPPLEDPKYSREEGIINEDSNNINKDKANTIRNLNYNKPVLGGGPALFNIEQSNTYRKTH